MIFIGKEQGKQYIYYKGWTEVRNSEGGKSHVIPAPIPYYEGCDNKIIIAKDMTYNYNFVAMPPIFSLNGTSFKVLAALLSLSRTFKSDTFYHSNNDLMSMCRISDKTLKKALKELKEEGYITIKRNFNKAHSITVNFEKIERENPITGTSAPYGVESTPYAEYAPFTYGVESTPLGEITPSNGVESTLTYGVESTPLNKKENKINNNSTMLNEYSTSQTNNDSNMNDKLNNYRDRVSARAEVLFKEGTTAEQYRQWINSCKSSMAAKGMDEDFIESVLKVAWKKYYDHFSADVRKASSTTTNQNPSTYQKTVRWDDLPQDMQSFINSAKHSLREVEKLHPLKILYMQKVDYIAQVLKADDKCRYAQGLLYDEYLACKDRITSSSISVMVKEQVA